MPHCCGVFPFFIVFSSGAMGVRCKLVLLGGFPVCFVHACLLAL